MDMSAQALIEMMHNVAVLLAVGLLFDVLASPLPMGGKHRLAPWCLGIFFGIAGVVVMLSPVPVAPGVMVDARAILLGVAGLFFGIIPVVITACITSAFRIYMGGVGEIAGLLMIWVSGSLGVAWRHLRKRERRVSCRELYCFGVVLYLVILALMLTLPHEIGPQLLSRILLPVMLLGPLATMLLGCQILRHLAHDQAESALRESEERFRLLYQSAPIAYQSLDSGGNFLEVNNHFCMTLGYTREELLGTWFGDLLHPDWKNHFKENFPKFKARGEISGVEFKMRRKTGEYLLVSFTGRIGKTPDGEFRQTYCVFRDITQERMAEELFRETARKHQIIFENSPLGMVYFDASGTIEDCNNTFVDLMGSTKEKILGFNTIRNSSPDMSAALQLAIDGNPSNFEDMYTSVTGGNTLYLRVIFTPVHLGKSPTEVIATLEDVSEKHHADELLRESEIRFRTLHNASFGGITIHDKGIILDCNQGLSDITGYSVQELIGMDGLLLIAGPDRQTVMDHILAGYEKPYEVSGVRKSGEIYPVRLQGKNIPYKGRPVRVVEFRDITDQKRAGEQLRQSEARFRAIIENVDVAVQGYDREMRVVYWNKASERLYGYTEQEALGGNLLDLIIPDAMRGDVARAVKEWIENDVPIPADELVLRGKDGSDVPVYSSHALQRKADGSIEFFCVDLDLSEFKKMRDDLLEAKEQAEAASRAKSEFLANMSHELRTPLNGIMGMLQLMEETALDTEQRGYAQAAVESSKRLTRLLSDILDLSRIEAGKLEIMHEPFDLRDAVHSLEQLFSPSASQLGNRIVVHIAPEIPAMLNGDALRLQQVLSNLVGNSLKFTRHGTVTVECYPLPVIREGTYRVLFTVSDTGQGIPDAKLGILFEPFTQVDSGLSRQHQGAGLGLSICKRLAAMMGGSIAISSEQGVGTSVYFCATFGCADMSGAGAGAGVRKEVKAFRPFRILLAEDERVNRALAVKLLENQGHTVVAVVDGKHALEVLRDGDFDIVLMDIQMPVMDGMDATRAIRNGEAGDDKKDIPIIALTAHAMTGDRERFLGVGMNEYLTKPFEKSALLDALGRVKA